MIIGTIALSTNQGLGYLVRDFYRNGLIEKVLVQSHVDKKDNPDWFNKKEVDLNVNANWPYCKTISKENLIKIMSFLKEIDILLLFETPFYLDIFKLAESVGVKTVLFPMYEITPFPMYPDAFITTSDLDHQYYTKLYPKVKSYRINIPVPSEIKWNKRKTAKTFIHNSGNGGTYGRNGTNELIESMKYVKSPIKLIIRSQKPIEIPKDSRIEVINKSVKFEDLWSSGDVFVFPEKFNGLSLPIQEAYASGLAVMCGDRFPMNQWLPKEILIPIENYDTKNITNVKFKSAIFCKKNIAKTIDMWYNKEIEEISIKGKKWYEENNWSTLKQKYLNIFQEVING